MNEKKTISNQNVSPDIFKNKWLNYLTRTHILVPIGMVVAFSGWLIYRSSVHTDFSALKTALLFFTGFFVFTLAEYVLHRNLYHIEPTSEWRAKFAYAIHGAHHDFPKDKQRLAMPPLGIIIYVTVFYAIFRLALGDYGYATLSGFAIGYVGYLGVHYCVHAFRPPNNFLKALWTNHAIHHYHDNTVLYGVSSPLWDYVFGTIPRDKQKKGKSVEVKA